MRKARVVVLAVAVLGVAAAVAMAQTPPPTVAITASPTSVAVAGGPVAAGPTRFELTREASETGLTVFFGLLVPGVSVEQFQAQLQRDDQAGTETALGLISVQASVPFEGAQTTRHVTFDLKPGVTYVVLSEPDTEDGPPPSRGITTFATSTTANGASAPAPQATVRMVGLRFKGSRTLPRNGVVRFVNDDGVPHFALAMPLRKRVTTAQVGRAVKSENDSALGRVVSGQPVTAQHVISGATANDQELSFPKAGRYVLVCFVNEHHKLGMYRVVTVR